LYETVNYCTTVNIIVCCQRDVEKLQAKALDEKERKKQASIAKLKKRLTEK